MFFDFFTSRRDAETQRKASKSVLCVSASLREKWKEITYNYLIELQTTQKINGTIIKRQIDNHILQFQSINSKYTLSEYKAISGPLSDNAWENVDYNDLYRTVESYISSRKRMNVSGNMKKKGLLTLTEKVLDRLIKRQEDISDKK